MVGGAYAPRHRWRRSIQRAFQRRGLPAPETSHAGASQELRGSRFQALQRVCRPFATGPLMPLKASRPCFQIRNSAPSTSFQAQTRSLIVVQDWEHPVRAPSKETKGLEPSPNPNWHSSGLNKDPNPIVQDWKHPVNEEN